MTEEEIIRLFIRGVPRNCDSLKVGVGDDCSVIGAGKKDVLITTDGLVENVHFQKNWGPWKTWGAKLAGCTLSDIAAMGGKPLYAWLSLALPKKFPKHSLSDFQKGFRKVLRREKVVLAGGNVTNTPKYFGAYLTVWGEIAKGKAMLRSNARPGDIVYLSGPFKNHRKTTPTSRIKLGQFLVKRGCLCCIDVSDGLLQDAHHIAKASGVAITIEADKIPKGNLSLRKALIEGENYELLFTFPRGKKLHTSPVRIRPIGKIERGKAAVTLLNREKHPILLEIKGYRHNI